MRIAQLATNVERVPPPGYGGTELVIHYLTEGLVKRGHDVTLFATGDSLTKAKLISTIASPLRNHGEYHQTQWQAFDLRTLLQLTSMSSEFDLVHNHMGYAALPYLAQLKCPIVTTNHNPIKDYCASVYLKYAELPYVSISNAYRRFNYGSQLNYVATIYNGIAIEDFANKSHSGSYLLFLGRISPDKGTADAISIAEKLDLPLKIAGKIDARDEDYFNSLIKPHLSNGKIEYWGEVNMQQKIELYKGAIAVVYPVAFEEPFGLVLAESLASATPVLAYDRGAIREILTDGETAIIANSVDQIIARFDELKNISTSACLARSLLFSKERMIEAYEKLYEKLLQSKSYAKTGINYPYNHQALSGR